MASEESKVAFAFKEAIKDDLAGATMGGPDGETIDLKRRFENTAHGGADVFVTADPFLIGALRENESIKEVPLPDPPPTPSAGSSSSSSGPATGSTPTPSPGGSTGGGN